jgi:hypothetical protein
LNASGFFNSFSSLECSKDGRNISLAGQGAGHNRQFLDEPQCKYDLEAALEAMGSKIEREVLPIKE